MDACDASFDSPGRAGRVISLSGVEPEPANQSAQGPFQAVETESRLLYLT